ncbi:MAG: beta-glucosidase [Bacilli bacterium]|nr:beta-glucosidase [Bacilli bacterium]
MKSLVKGINSNMESLTFPQDFIWGAATAAYQIEGAFDEGGRGLSIWDTFAHTPGKVFEGHTGDTACDSYHRYPEDIRFMKELGISSYRFSISWPRIFPTGTGPVNQEGLDYYHRFVDELIANGIVPYCTLYHWDLPQALQEMGGWKNRATIAAFVHYAEFMFREFGAKIKHWMTFNEPWCISFLSNYEGQHAPGFTDLQLAVTVAHHVLVAHGKTVQSFRKLLPDGEIGYVPNTDWAEPYSERAEDREACRRKRAYVNEWFLQPVLKGSYPDFMIDWYRTKGAELPILPGDLEVISQPIDFLGVNYYSGGVGRFKAGAGLFDCEMIEMGYVKTDIGWNIYPDGFYRVLHWIKQEYGNIFGYSMRFGLIHVDFNTFQRTPKDSFYWYKKWIGRGERND